MSGFGISTICFGGSEWHSVQKNSQLAVSINWVSFWLGAPRIRALLFGVYIRASFGNSQMRGPYQPRHLTISSQAVGLMEESCSSSLSQLARDSLSGAFVQTCTLSRSHWSPKEHQKVGWGLLIRFIAIAPRIRVEGFSTQYLSHTYNIYIYI